jgi:nucleoside-diphosphate-sugar epimerase
MTLSILVTGGAGYLGSIMVPDLLDLGHKVTVLDTFLYKQNSLAHVCCNANFQVVNGDARIEDTVAPLLAKADVVIPLAALVGAPICDKNPIGAKSLNLDAQMMLFDHLSRDQRVLMPITNSGYGVGEAGKHCTEETPLRPISLYGRHKVEVEARALERENTISSPRHRVRHGAQDAYRFAGQRFRLPRRL